MESNVLIPIPVALMSLLTTPILAYNCECDTYFRVYPLLFSVDAFNQGAVNTSITASFTSICCHPGVLFVGLDLVGNMGTCSISLVPDIVSLRANPSNTAVSLYPGNTTKVPFTLLNLGSAGSFSFQVTKAPKIISYVIPFSLALESNVSAAGYVMIKSLSEVNEMQNLTVKAISQSNSASVKEVTLVQIKVLVLKHVRLEVVAPNDSFSLSPRAEAGG